MYSIGSGENQAKVVGRTQEDTQPIYEHHPWLRSGHVKHKSLVCAVNGCYNHSILKSKQLPTNLLKGDSVMSKTAATSADKNKARTRRFFNRRTVRFPMLLLMLMSLILASAASATSVQAQAANTTFKFSDSFPFSFFNNCTGEVVSGVVNVKGTIHETIDASGGFHSHIHEVFNGRAVGETSGIQYVGPQTDHDSFHVSSSGALEDTFTLNFRFISQGSADNILTHILFHITITPNGDVTSEISNITDVCRG